MHLQSINIVHKSKSARIVSCLLFAYRTLLSTVCVCVHAPELLRRYADIHRKWCDDRATYNNQTGRYDCDAGVRCYANRSQTHIGPAIFETAHSHTHSHPTLNRTKNLFTFSKCSQTVRGALLTFSEFLIYPLRTTRALRSIRCVCVWHNTLVLCDKVVICKFAISGRVLCF